MPEPANPSSFLQSVRDAVRVRHFSICTEESHVHRIRRFFLFNARRHSEEMGDHEVAGFLSPLAYIQGNAE
ncbi:MAG: phage integrase N-terminal SAM-like domain-containing protein [Burkholderiales bacterium]